MTYRTIKIRKQTYKELKLLCAKLGLSIVDLIGSLIDRLNDLPDEELNGRWVKFQAVDKLTGILTDFTPEELKEFDRDVKGPRERGRRSAGENNVKK